MQVVSQRGIKTGIMVDFSHANSQKQFKNQLNVATDVAQQIAAGNHDLVSCMIESHLVEGRQDAEPGKELIYGQSITDACINFDDTEQIFELLAQSISRRK